MNRLSDSIIHYVHSKPNGYESRQTRRSGHLQEGDRGIPLTLYFRQSFAPNPDLDFRVNRFRGDQMNPADYARLAEECSRQADAMQPSPERDALMEKARQYASYAKIYNWVASKELQPPN